MWKLHLQHNAALDTANVLSHVCAVGLCHVSCCPQKLGSEMEQLEAAQSKLNDRLIKLSVACSDMAAIEEASTALTKLQAEYEAKEARWFELAEIAGDI